MALISRRSSVLSASRILSAAVLVAVPAVAQIYPGQQFRCAESYANASMLADLDLDGHPDIVSSHGNFDGTTVSFGRGDGSFEPAIPLGQNAAMYGAAAADVNHDGHPDLVLLNGGPSQAAIEVWLGDGARGFQLHASLPAAYFFTSVALADLDGDTNLDIVAANNSTGDVAVRLGDGQGGFGGATTFPSGATHPLNVVAADFDGDGNVDVATQNTNSLSVLFGDGTGALSGTPVLYTAGFNFPKGLRVARMNPDAAPDLVAANENPGQVYVFLNDRTGVFHPSATSFASPIESFDVADVNGDGREDVVVVGGYDRALTTALGDGTGHLEVLPRTTPVTGYGFLGLGDVDSDGAVDAVLGDAYATVHLGRGNGRFEGMTLGGRALGAGTAVAIALGDLDGDGSLDAVTASYDSRLDARLNDGHGVFAPVGEADLTSGMHPSDVELGDLDEDGHLDVVASIENAGKVAVLLGVGGGAFGAPAYLSVGTGPADVVLADLNGDHHLDILTANHGSSDVTVRLGDGHGAFGAPIAYPTGVASPSGLVVGEFTGDGVPDVVVSDDEYMARIALLPGDGSGGFGTPSTFLVSPRNGAHSKSIAAADLDGDGHLDVVTANNGLNELAVLLSDGAGGFRPPSAYEIHGERPEAIAIADVDLDGHLDLIASTYMAGPSVRLGTVTGSFLHETNFALPVADPHALAVADVDGDGRPDLLSSSSGAGDVFILKQRGEAPNEPCALESYCHANSNSVFFAGTHLTGSGPLSIAQNGFSVHATGLVPNTTALLYYGPRRGIAVYGDGWRCVAGAVSRLGPAQTATAQGTLVRPLDFTSPPLGSGPGQVVPGIPCHFQVWYRDTGHSGGAGFNLSDGLQATFCP